MKKALTLLMAFLVLAVGVNAAFEKVNTYENNFTDVPDSAWYAENVRTAYELGFMNGKSEGKFDPDGNVTVIEAITMATRLHAIYNGTEVKPRENEVSEYRIDFDNLDNIKFNNAEGKIVDGVVQFSPVGPNQYGSYDPGIVFTNLNLDSREYNKLKIRLKRDELPHANGSTQRNEYSEIYFGTSMNNAFSGDKCVYAQFNKFATDYSDWFIIETDLGQHPQWKDTITQLRYDPANDNGIFYIDYIILSKSETVYNAKWYDMYVDYAADNGIIKNASYSSKDYNRNITREELCNLFACALPEEYFAPINEIAGIPDMDKNAKYSDIILAFYKAGIVLGSDEAGNFNPKSDIKRSEVAAIINRVALPENRVKGELVTGWMSGAHKDDLEFDDEKMLESLDLGEEKVEIKNGSIVLVPTRKSSGMPPFDPRVGVRDISVNAGDVIKIKVRAKYEIIGEMTNSTGEIFFIPEGQKDFSGSYSQYFSFDEGYVVDAFGWRVYEFDFSLKETWKGNITGLRFDPANAEGVFTIDYIHFVPQPYVEKTHEQLIAEGYTATNLLQDSSFERGFEVAHFEQKKVDLSKRKWQYNEGSDEPLWEIGPWWTKYDLYDDRDLTTDKYTIADKHGTKMVRYNPEEKSVTMRLDCTKIYEGQPHINGEYNWWPHLLLNQAPHTATFDKKVCSAAADRVYATIDLRMTDYKPTTNTAGTNNCSYLIYYYLYCDKAPGKFIYFGLNLFTDTQFVASPINWAPDSAGGRYMYCLRQHVVYDGMENSFQPTKGSYVIGDDWKSLRVDMTPHIDRCVEWANRDNVFGMEITKEDLYFAGANIGFETHGNIDATFEFKNFGMIAYNKD